MALTVIAGTWEEIERRKAELVGRRLLVRIESERPTVRRTRPATRRSALGKYAFVAGGSEEFAKEKQAEIEREDRSR